MIAIADNKSHDEDYSSGFPWISPQDPVYAGENILGSRHRGRANIAFCDGHIEQGKRNQVIAPTEAARRRWNIDNLPHPETWR